MVELQIRPERASDAERAAVDAVVADLGPAWHRDGDRVVAAGRAARDDRRHLLLPALHALQSTAGWISPGGLDVVADRLQVPVAEAYGVATFYDLFRTADPGPPGPVHHVCVDGPCLVGGSAELHDRLVAEGADVHTGSCLGQCERAPGHFVQGVGEPDRVPAGATVAGSAARALGCERRLLARVGAVDPTSLASYRDHGGYRALAIAHATSPTSVIDAVADAGLSGRGGAAFPTGAKWRSVAEAPGPVRHVVANADESEPGTFKDRVLLEDDPFALVEAMTIAGFAVGAERGWIYVRGEYPTATARLAAAIDQARAAGLLGRGVAGSQQTFDIEIRRGAGAYICGEETALFNSIEGFRGEPRTKPPYPTTHGLFGQPTAVNNPETLVNVVPILTDGVDAHRSLGTDDSPGTKLFCLSGRVARPGVYEVPFGVALSELLGEAGALHESAVLLGGAAGRFVAPDQLDVPLSLEATRAEGLALGSGAVMVFAPDEVPAVVTGLAEFFRRESCGQCVPCRVGTVRQHELLKGSHDGARLDGESRRLLHDLATVMGDASICGLGHTAADAVQSALELGLIGGRR